MQKKSRNSRGKSRAMEIHFYPIDFFFSFTRLFLWTLRKIPYYFFLCPVSISRIMNAKKISKFEREVKGNGNTLLPHRFFFSFTGLFLWTLRKILYYFFSCPISISTVMNARKNSKFTVIPRFRGNSLLFRRKAPNFSEHQIIASTIF